MAGSETSRLAACAAGGVFTDSDVRMHVNATPIGAI
jgi:hypothetical protein